MRTSILLALERLPWVWRMRLGLIGTVATHYAAFQLGQKWATQTQDGEEGGVDPIDEPFEKRVLSPFSIPSILHLCLAVAVERKSSHS